MYEFLKIECMREVVIPNELFFSCRMIDETVSEVIYKSHPICQRVYHLMRSLSYRIN